MKKYLGLLLCLGLLLQNFSFVIPVFAEENNETSVEIVSITQDGDTLELKNGKYEVLGVEELTLNFKINNSKENIRYSIQLKNNYFSFGIGIDEERINEIQNTTIWLDKYHQDTDYTLCVYEVNQNDEFIKLVAEKQFVLNNLNYNDLNYANSKLVVSKVEQGGKEITPTINEYYNTADYELNDIEDVELTLIGENLDDDTKYKVFNNQYRQQKNEYTGLELKNGINVVIPINTFNQKGIQMDLKLDIYNENIINSYKVNDYVYYTASYNFNENDEISIPNIKFKYENKELDLDNNLEDYLYEDYGDIHTITPNEYDDTKPLTLNIQTQDLENKDYKTEISIYRNNEKLYSKDVNINGLSLNNGYDLDLDNFKLEIPTDVENKLSAYEIFVRVNNITTKDYLTYRENGKINRSLFYDTGEKTIIRHAGWDGIYGSGLIFEVNDKIFNEYKTMYFHYLGTNFENDTMYNYEIYYGEDDDVNENIINRKLITSGTITGKELNENGVMQPITDENDYLFPAYMFVVKKGNNLVYYDKSQLNKINTPTLTTIKVSSNNKNVYMQMSNYNFIATKNAPLTIAVDGIGFDETKDYTYILFDSYNSEETETYATFSGKDLNNGTATFKISKGKDDLTTRNIGVVVLDEEGFGISWGEIDIEYVDSKKYFPTDIPYVIDNAKDLIKSIKKETSVNDFVASLDIKDSGNIKVYDKTGTEEITDNVGTGMIARITDEYNNNIMDLDVVVKGDVSGDGNISITDVVNVARHVADINKLDGIYEIAANVTDTGTIGLTDLVQISQDVAGIKEVQ
ncbi:MAG: dockerin type I repeat-containing protein [Bacilli bacterium]|nr:dockerin type I repeat-containing protein [Bacilli bacterium]